MNASRILEGQYDVPSTMRDKMRLWLREFTQKAKSLLGKDADGTILRSLEGLYKNNGNFTSGRMLHYTKNMHLLYTGEKAARGEIAEDLATAKQWEEWGFKPNNIRQATGWFRNPHDNMWRHEIGDEHSEWLQPTSSFTPPERKEGARVRLDQLLNHPSLFDTYPDARNIEVTPFNNKYSGLRGEFNESDNHIRVNMGSEDPFSTLLHEVQHWVQAHEGFAPGGDTSSVLKAMTPEQRGKLGVDLADEQAPKSARDQREIDLLDKVAAHPNLKEWSAAERAYEDSLKTNDSDAQQEAYNERARLRQEFYDSAGLNDRFGARQVSGPVCQRELRHQLEQHAVRDAGHSAQPAGCWHSEGRRRGWRTTSIRLTARGPAMRMRSTGCFLSAKPAMQPTGACPARSRRATRRRA